jgi:hypothetical protein
MNNHWNLKVSSLGRSSGEPFAYHLLDLEVKLSTTLTELRVHFTKAHVRLTCATYTAFRQLLFHFNLFGFGFGFHILPSPDGGK